MTYRLRQFNLKSVVKRGKFFEIRFTNPRTQKREYYKLGATRDEVRKNLPEFNRMYAGLKRQTFSYRITVVQGIQSWLEQKRTELSNKNTVVRYGEIMHNFAEFLKDRSPALEYMDELTQKHFEEFKEYRKNIKGKQEKTINFELDMLSNLFKRLMEKNYLSYNPLSRVKRLQEPYKEERWFTQGEVLKILKVAKGAQFFCQIDLKRTAQLLLKLMEEEENGSSSMHCSAASGLPQDFVFVGLRSPPFGRTVPEAE